MLRDGGGGREPVGAGMEGTALVVAVVVDVDVVLLIWLEGYDSVFCGRMRDREQGEEKSGQDRAGQSRSRGRKRREGKDRGTHAARLPPPLIFDLRKSLALLEKLSPLPPDAPVPATHLFCKSPRDTRPTPSATAHDRYIPNASLPHPKSANSRNPTPTSSQRSKSTVAGINIIVLQASLL